ncbi:MAG: LacI family DNA-binding transcriptional regulator [Pseudomonadota bacterium]
MPVTLKDVAARAGVSRSAVSRTFTQGASVSKQTRDKVERAAAALGYRPNALASSLTTGRTKLIGLISNNFRNPFFLEVFDLFTRRLQEKGLRPLLVNLSGETDPTNSVDLLRQYSVDGVIVASSTLDPAFARAFRDAGLPVVHSFGRPDGASRVDVVGVDNVACGRIAGQTLVARGYRKVAFLGGPRAATSTQDRLLGFCQALDAEGLTPGITFADAYTFEAGRITMAAALVRCPAEAYFCGDDILSIGAMAAVRAAGLSVPGDIGLMGFNDMEMAGWPSIDLTTLHQPVARIIESSIDLVSAHDPGDPRGPEIRLFECRLIERATLKPKVEA